MNSAPFRALNQSLTQLGDRLHRLRNRLRSLPLTAFRPCLVDSLSNYDRSRFVRDVAAGITVGVVALPLAMAFAIASGVKPEAGLITAIVAGFLISALGGSRVQIGGPAGAFIVVVYGIIERYGLPNLLICTMLAGVLLFLMGLTGLGSMVRFIPVAIVIGFTNGIAVLIALSQLKEALGLPLEKMPADFFRQLALLTHALPQFNPYALALCLTSFAVLLLWPKLYAQTAAAPRWQRWLAQVPGTVVALALATVVVCLADLPVATIGSRFGGIPQSLPAPAWPSFSWELVKQLMAPTLTIALLGAVESLLCARVADGLIDDRHNPNQELMAQGIANLVTPLFGGICATGTVARTVTNVKSGATSPIAGIVHAATLLAIVLVAAPFATHIPLATLAAILLFVAWNMGEWHEFARLPKFSPTYRITLLTTFLLTVILDVTVAVEVGIALAALFFIYRISTLTRVEAVGVDHLPSVVQAANDWRMSIEAYRLHGSLFFGSVHKLEVLTNPARLSQTRAAYTVMVLDFTPLLSLDTTGLEAIDSLRRQLGRCCGQLVIAGAREQPMSLLQRSGLATALGGDHLIANFDDAIQHAAALCQQNLSAPGKTQPQ